MQSRNNSTTVLTITVTYNILTKYDQILNGINLGYSMGKKVYSLMSLREINGILHYFLQHKGTGQV